MSRFAVVIPSCDRYSDLWQPYFQLFFRFWPRCQAKIYLSSNFEKFSNPLVTTVTLGADTSWSEQLRKLLGQVPEEIVLLSLEDFFLQESVEETKLLQALSLFEDSGSHMVRLVPRPEPHGCTGDFDEIGVGEPYRVSTQASLWRKSTLQALLVDSENIWEFEQDASRRSKLFPSGFWGVHKEIFPYKHHVIERGKWFPWAAKKYSVANIGVDLTRRQVMNVWETVVWVTKKLRGEVSRRVQRIVQQLFQVKIK